MTEAELMSRSRWIFIPTCPPVDSSHWSQPPSGVSTEMETAQKAKEKNNGLGR